MRTACYGILLLFLLGSAPECPVADTSGSAVTLVRDGRPVAAVHLPPEAPRACFQAAAELVRYIRRMSGAELPVFVDGADHAPARLIRIVRARPADRQDTENPAVSDLLPIRIGVADENRHDERVRMKSRRSDAFTLAVSETGIDILGLQPVGTQHAVFELLRQLGVRWFDPLKDGLVIPKKTTVTLTNQYTVQVPSDELRMMPPVTLRETLYTIRMKREHLMQLLESPHVSPTPSGDADFVIGWTTGWDGDPELYWEAAHVPPVTKSSGESAVASLIPSQPIHAYRITDREADGPKATIVLTDGNQSEYAASWTFHALIAFLVGESREAVELRRHADFYVYPLLNPDGRKMMSRERNPELLEAGWHNHKRVWDSVGLFSTVDTLTGAIRYDTGGQADYLIDFHAGMTRHVTATHLLDSPLVRAMKARTHFDVTAMTIRGAIQEWAMRDEGLGVPYGYTTYVEDWEDWSRCMEVGEAYGLALHDVLVGESFSEQDVPEDVRNVPPRRRWLQRRHTPSSFLEALEYSDAERTALFLKNDPDVNIRNRAGNTALHLATEEGSVEMIRELLERGANVNAKNTRGWTPLHIAVRFACPEGAALLVTHGADVNARHIAGDTPLHIAAAYNRLDLVDILLNAGADSDVQGQWGRTPMDWARRLGYGEIIERLAR